IGDSKAAEEGKEVREEEEVKVFRGCIQTRGEKIEAIDADEDITLADVETQVDMDAELHRRIDQDVSTAEPTVFDDEEEVEKAAAIDKQKKDDLERAQVLQKKYDDKDEHIDWNAIAEQIQEKHLDNIRKYQNLKRKPVSIAQARKNMIIYLKNMVGYKMEHYRETSSNDPKEMSEEDLQNMLEIIPVSKFKVEALQVKYPIIEWEIHSEESRFRIDPKSLNKVFVLAVLDLSKVANPLYLLRDKDLLKSKDPQEALVMK
nr:hypothetical protein [Tanacetum cinerariifolium]